MIKGDINANLSDSEKSAHDKDKLQIVVKTGTRSSTHFLSIQVGIGSSTHDFVGDFDIMRRTSSCVTGVNSVSGAPENKFSISGLSSDFTSF